jgi:hypothetical protein
MRKISFYIKFLLILSALSLIVSCNKERVNLRSLAANDSLIYLETNDLGEIFQTFTETQSWQIYAKNTPDISAISGVRAAIAITGFESDASDVSLNIKPKFVVILDTNSFEGTSIVGVETQISKFLKDAKLEKNKKLDVNFLTWTTKDNRKIIAAITGSTALISNDEASIMDFLAVKSGEKPSLIKNEKLNELATQKPLAFGLVQKNGVNEIASLLSIRLAIDNSEENVVRSLITKILPNVIDKSVQEITWLSNKSTNMIEDKIFVKLNSDVAKNLQDSLEFSSDAASKLSELIPVNTYSTTIYSLQSPRLAFQGLVRTFVSQSDELSGKIVENFSEIILQAYGIKDNEKFFSSIGGTFVTAQIDPDGEESVVVVRIRDEARLKSSVIKDEEFSLKIIGDIAILGEAETVAKIELGGNSEVGNETKPAVTTITDETENTKILVGNLVEMSITPNELKSTSVTSSAAKFDGIERIRVSDFGLLGDILTLAKPD